MREPDFAAIVERRNGPALSRALSDLHPADIAALMGQLPTEESDFVFSELPDPVAAEILDELEPGTRQSILSDVPAARIGSVIGHLEVDDAAELVSGLPSEQSAEVLANLDAAFASEIRTALKYSDDTAGRLMTTTYVSLEQSTPAGEAVAEVRDQVAGPGEIFYIYVVDADGQLVGVLSVRALLLAAETEPIGDLCDINVVRVRINSDREEVARTMAKYDLLIVPVVDYDGRLVGTVTIDDALDVLQEEAIEDILRLSGSFEPARNRTSRRGRVFYRLPWLLVTVVGELAVALVLTGFIGQLERIIALALFIPIVSATAGSVGIQSLAASLTATAERVSARRAIMSVLGETRSGLVLGVVSGVIAGGLATLWKSDVMLGTAIALSMALSLTTAALLGAAVPMVLSKARIDPAIASGPLITTLNDALSLSIYLAVAGWLLAGA